MSTLSTQHTVFVMSQSLVNHYQLMSRVPENSYRHDNNVVQLTSLVWKQVDSNAALQICSRVVLYVRPRIILYQQASHKQQASHRGIKRQKRGISVGIATGCRKFLVLLP